MTVQATSSRLPTPGRTCNALMLIRDSVWKRRRKQWAGSSRIVTPPNGSISRVSLTTGSGSIIQAGVWINRDPIREAGGSNVYGMVGNNPINRVDPWGLTDYPAQWVEEQKMLIRRYDTNLYWGAWNHGTNGRFDYKRFLDEFNDRICLNGRWVTPGGFGNYAVGYGAFWGGGNAGVGGAALAGHPFEIASRIFGEPRSDNYTGYLDAPVDQNFIGEGASDANSDQYMKRLWQQRKEMNMFRQDEYLLSEPMGKPMGKPKSDCGCK